MEKRTASLCTSRGDDLMNRFTILAVSLFACACASASRSLAQCCDFPPKALTDGDRREYRGRYQNKASGYSVVIPENLVGYETVNPLYQRGFGLILGSERESYIYVNGEPNSLAFARPADAASNLLGYLRRGGSQVLWSKVTPTRLGKLTAAYLVARYTCPGGQGPYQTASVVAISKKGDRLYEVTLYANADRFDRDKPVLGALVKSWKYLGPHW